MKRSGWLITRWSRAVLVISMIALVGCGAPAKRVYQPNPPDPSVRQLPLRVVVVELEDGSVGDGFVYYPGSRDPSGLLPGVLSVTDSVSYRQTMFGKCLATELQGMHSFATIKYYQTWENLAEDFGSYDLVVTGRLGKDETRVYGRFYGLSLLSPIAYILGLPAFAYTREVGFDVWAFEPWRPDRQFWKYAVGFKDSSWKGVFTARRDDDVVLADPQKERSQVVHTDFCTTELLQPQFLALRKSLFAAVQERILSQGAPILSGKHNGERRGS